jgi:hypothetical protein
MFGNRAAAAQEVGLSTLTLIALYRRAGVAGLACQGNDRGFATGQRIAITFLWLFASDCSDLSGDAEVLATRILAAVSLQSIKNSRDTQTRGCFGCIKMARSK